MKTKDFLLVGVGLGLGYFLFKRNPFKRKTDLEQVSSDIKEVVEDTKDVITTTLNSVRQAECEKQWNNFSQTIRPSSAESLEKMKTEFISNCLLKK